MLIKEILSKIGDNHLKVMKLVDDWSCECIFEGQATDYDQDEILIISTIYADDSTIVIEVEGD